MRSKNSTANIHAIREAARKEMRENREPEGRLDGQRIIEERIRARDLANAGRIVPVVLGVFCGDRAGEVVEVTRLWGSNSLWVGIYRIPGELVAHLVTVAAYDSRFDVYNYAVSEELI